PMRLDDPPGDRETHARAWNLTSMQSFERLKNDLMVLARNAGSVVGHGNYGLVCYVFESGDANHRLLIRAMVANGIGQETFKDLLEPRKISRHARQRLGYLDVGCGILN